MFKIEKGNINYLAKIVRLSGLRKHSNADRLQCVSVDGSNVITDMTAQDGDVYVFFPLECKINKEFLSWSNSFEDKDLNSNKEERGFFNKHGRVRAIRLRGERSEGYVVPAEKLFEWLGVEFSEDLVGKEFDTYVNITICEKYIPKVKQSQGTQRSNKKVKRESKIVDKQFRLSEDTAHLKRNLHKFDPYDVITVSYKVHGCNTSLGKVLCKRKLSFVEKAARLFGAKISETEYDLVYASRRVIKSDKKLFKGTKNPNKGKVHFYGDDVWGIIAERYKDSIKDGITLYGEIVGQLPNGSWIQKDYDYGQPNGYCDLFVYRITYTSPSGDVFDFTNSQMVNYCKSHGLNTVPVLFHGNAHEFCPDIPYDGMDDDDVFDIDGWRECLLKTLIETYTEKECFMCKNKVPEEGVVIVKEQEVFEPFKLKSFAFLERETKELDKGQENIDDS